MAAAKCRRAGSATLPLPQVWLANSVADQENSFFDGIDVTLPGIATLAGDQEHAFLTDGLCAGSTSLVEQAIQSYSVTDPSAIAPMLADGLSATDKLIDQVKGSSLSDEAKYNVLHELNVKHAQFNDALALGVESFHHGNCHI